MKRFLPKGLMGQLVLLIFAAFIIAQILGFFLFANERGRAVHSALGAEAADKVTTIARLVEEAQGGSRAAIVTAANSSSVRFTLDREASVALWDDQYVDVVARLHRLLSSDHRRNVDARAVLEAISPHGPMPENLPPPARWMRDRMLGAGIAPARLRVAVQLADGQWLNMSMRLQQPGMQRPPWFALAMLLSLVSMIAALWFGLRRITGPLRQLVLATDHLGRGEELPPLPASGPREVQALSSAFLTMQERLTRLLSDRTRMLAALGHDLRSPITALRVRAEMIDDSETRERMVATLDEMQEMVEATLAYARGIATSEPTETVDLVELVSGLAGEVSESGPAVDVQPAASLTTRLRRTSIRRALRNVFENAQRYGGGAEVRISPEAGLVRISVIDNGPGIAPEALERVFDPFVRLEESRSRDTGGTGLGLSIARTILRAHGGDIILANRQEGGLEAKITLPLTRDNN